MLEPKHRKIHGSGLGPPLQRRDSLLESNECLAPEAKEPRNDHINYAKTANSTYNNNKESNEVEDNFPIDEKSFKYKRHGYFFDFPADFNAGTASNSGIQARDQATIQKSQNVTIVQEESASVGATQNADDRLYDPEKAIQSYKKNNTGNQRVLKIKFSNPCFKKSSSEKLKAKSIKNKPLILKDRVLTKTRNSTAERTKIILKSPNFAIAPEKGQSQNFAKPLLKKPHFTNSENQVSTNNVLKLDEYFSKYISDYSRKVKRKSKQKRTAASYSSFTRAVNDNEHSAYSSGSAEALEEKCSKIVFSKSGVRNRAYLLSTALAEYKHVKILGNGSYGSVTLMENVITRQSFAVKKVFRFGKSVERIVDKRKASILERRVIREANLTSMLGQIHPHITALYDIRMSDRYYYMFFEHNTGPTLSERVGEFGLPETEAKALFRQMVETIKFCHLHSVAHRDIKLENIMIDYQILNNSNTAKTACKNPECNHVNYGTIKFIDFGLGSFWDPRERLLTFCGSPLYTAPEIFKGIPYLGPEIDIWSLGVCLYAMVSGKFPFENSKQGNCVDRMEIPLYFMPEHFSSSLKDLIRLIIEPDMQKRPTADEILGHPWLEPIPLCKKQNQRNKNQSTNDHYCCESCLIDSKFLKLEAEQQSKVSKIASVDDIDFSVISQISTALVKPPNFVVKEMLNLLTHNSSKVKYENYMNEQQDTKEVYQITPVLSLYSIILARMNSQLWNSSNNNMIVKKMVDLLPLDEPIQPAILTSPVPQIIPSSSKTLATKSLQRFRSVDNLKRFLKQSVPKNVLQKIANALETQPLKLIVNPKENWKQLASQKSESALSRRAEFEVIHKGEASKQGIVNSTGSNLKIDKDVFIREIGPHEHLENRIFISRGSESEIAVLEETLAILTNFLKDMGISHTFVQPLPTTSFCEANSMTHYAGLCLGTVAQDKLFISYKTKMLSYINKNSLTKQSHNKSSFKNLLSGSPRLREMSKKSKQDIILAKEFKGMKIHEVSSKKIEKAFAKVDIAGYISDSNLLSNIDNDFCGCELPALYYQQAIDNNQKGEKNFKRGSKLNKEAEDAIRSNNGLPKGYRYSFRHIRGKSRRAMVKNTVDDDPSSLIIGREIFDKQVGSSNEHELKSSLIEQNCDIICSRNLKSKKSFTDITKEVFKKKFTRQQKISLVDEEKPKQTLEYTGINIPISEPTATIIAQQTPKLIFPDIDYYRDKEDENLEIISCLFKIEFVYKQSKVQYEQLNANGLSVSCKDFYAIVTKLNGSESKFKVILFLLKKLLGESK